MMDIRYPEPGFKLRQQGGKEHIFDPLRKRWVVLTPEEWVRQNFVQYLLQVKHYPASLLAIEKEIRLGELKKRFDILVYDTAHRPWMMVECKAASVKLEEKVLQQALRYNIGLPVQYLVISNGNITYAWHLAAGSLQLLDALPEL